MARAHCREVFQDSDGDVQAGRTLVFYERDGTTPITTVIYKTATGSATYTAPELVTNSSGQFEGWSDIPKRVQISVSGVTTKTVTLFKADETDNTIRVTDCGAVGDGTTDDADAIQLAIDSLDADGGIVEFPGGPDRVYAVGASLTLRSNLILRGKATIRRGSGFTGTMFTLASGLDNVTLEQLTIDQNTSLSGKTLVADNAISRLTIQHCHFINMTYVSDALLISPNTVSSGAAMHEQITIRNNRFERTLGIQLNGSGKSDNENYKTIQIEDASRVRIEHNVFDHVGAVSVVACWSTAGNVRDIKIKDNMFLACWPTNLWVQHATNGDTIIDLVEISGNQFMGGGLYIEKGAIETGFGLASSVTRNMVISNNVIRGMGFYGSSGGVASQSNSPSMIHVGNGSFTDGVVITGNVIDGMSLAGDYPTGQNYGITISYKVRRFTISGNAVQFLGGAGIKIMSLSEWTVAAAGDTTIINNPPSHGAIVGNTVSHTGLQTTTDEHEGGIHIWYGYQISVSGNTCYNNGNLDHGAVQTAGIAIASGKASVSMITKMVAITGNTCTDTPTPVQLYGVRVGTFGNPDGDSPTYVTVAHNVCSGNGTLQVASSGTNHNYSIYHNLGAEGDATGFEATPFRRLTATTTWDPGLLADGAIEGKGITVTGARPGDIVLCSHDQVDTTGMLMTGTVSSNDTVGVTLMNKTGGNKDVASGTLRVIVEKY